MFMRTAAPAESPLPWDDRPGRANRDSVGDFAFERPGEGTDIILSRITLTLGADFENLTLVGPDAVAAQLVPAGHAPDVGDHTVIVGQ